ncbi:MAG: membrane protein insertase YidC [Ferruginibacter sp.]
MGLDRNTVIGMLLIGALLIGMFYVNSTGNEALLKQQQHIQDSLDRLKPKVDSSAIKEMDSARKVQDAGVFHVAASGPEQLTVVENNVMKITFTNKGGQPKIVELKNYKTFDGKSVVLQDGSFNKISYSINTGQNQTAETADLTFGTSAVSTNPDNSQTISFNIKDSTGQEILHQYTLRPDDYMLDFSIVMNGANQLITQNTINLLWQTQTTKAERDLAYERLQSSICYVTEGNYNYDRLGNTGNEEKFDKPVDWLAVKQQFFVTSLVNKNKFSSADIQWVVPADTSLHILTQSIATCAITVPAGSSATVPLQLYYGPSNYNILKKYNNQMEDIVPYGSGIFAFVKFINRYILLPVFGFLTTYVTNMGIAILLLTLFIRLLTSPILYKSYVSGAKMKLLKPEVDKLRAKFGDDKQGFSMEQMKLWKSAGVSPLGGCLPAVLQVPIFMSLYYFFQGNIILRGQSFLWSKDLASYDSIAHFSFSIPGYGDHMSLFTLTAVLTSLLISIYSMSNIQDDSNPLMKYMPYIFPVVLLGVFNKLPSALTWYYTISNTITLLLQIIIQKYIIDHDKILAQIEANRKKPVKQSKLQEKMLAMQESNKKLQDMKNKTNNR